MQPVHVLFVREKDQQMSTSGCCGRLEGDVIELSQRSGDGLFRERRQIMEEVGVLYRKLEEDFGGKVELEIIDPRNLMSLLVILSKQWRKQKVPMRKKWLQFVKGYKANAVFVNGDLLVSGTVPSYELLHDKVNTVILLDEQGN